MDPLSTLEIEPGTGVGIAVQIQHRIALLIADGRLETGHRLPSVRDLAGQLGVSVNTVRVAYARLASDGLVATRHGVGTVVLSPGRTPAVGGSPVMGSDTVAVLVGGLDPFYLPLVRGIEDVAAASGLLVLIGDTHDTQAVAEALVRRLVARGVAGIIAVSFGGVSSPPGRRRGSGGLEAPIVYVDQPERTGHVLVFDGVAAGASATCHLLDHGHRRIGIITASLAWPNERLVHDGYRSALEAAGVRRDPDLVSEVGEFSVAAGRAGLARLLDLDDPPSAVFVTGEVLGHGALAEARARGVPVPGDLAIAGYTDSPTAALVDPPLTMVAVPAREIGMRAMETLAARIAGRDPRPRRQVFAVSLVVRRSCGCQGEP
jgi:LacI family transcriptional regulator, galactose operon repressor